MMIYPTKISLEERQEAEKIFKAKFPTLVLEFSPAFQHYYVYNPETKEKSDNISVYEFYHEIIKI